MSSLIRASVFSFDPASFLDNGEYFNTMNNSIVILLRHVMGHDWVRKNPSSVYHRVSFKDKPKHEQWVCIRLENGTVVSLEPNTSESYSDIVGRYYGYDECCLAIVRTEEFVVNKSFQSVEKSGFFPCHKCFNKDRALLVSEIQQRRKCISPFPKSRYAIDCIDILHKILKGSIVIQQDHEPLNKRA